jgi:hypothetical protein
MTISSEVCFPACNAGSEPNPTEFPTRSAPRGLRIVDAAAYAGCSPWAIRSAIWTGKLRAKMIGRALVVLREDLDRYLESLPAVESKPTGLRVVAGKAVRR